jgi:uncharacterized protein (DUF488 family)
MPATLYSIGHSNHPWPRFLGLLEQHAVEIVADVRSVPYSRRYPQFNREVLARQLETAGLRYAFLGDLLGGRPQGDGIPSFAGPAWEQGLDQLVALAAEGPTAFLCAEGDPARCHRGEFVTPALLARGVSVRHILPDGRLLQAGRQLDLWPGEQQGSTESPGAGTTRR